MPKKTTAAFYAVRRGRSTGVFSTWEECKAQVNGFQGAKYKKFTNAADAKEYTTGSSPAKASATTPAKNGNNSSAPVTSPGNKGKKRARSPDIVDESGWDVVYCDGACKGNGQVGSVAGVGVWWGKDDDRNIAERCPGDQTNNRAELIAILRILETAPIHETPLLIKSDSSYSISCFKHWLPKWRSNNFRTANNEPVKNAPLIRYISAHLDRRAHSGQEVIMQHVKGHSGDVGNDAADALANRGAGMPSVAERDWEASEKEVRAKIGEKGTRRGEEIQLKFSNEVREPQGSPPKLRKMGHAPAGTEPKPREFAVSKPPDPVVADSPPPPPAVEQKVHTSIAERPRVVDLGEIDLELFKDCLLNDDELQNEIDD